MKRFYYSLLTLVILLGLNPATINAERTKNAPIKYSAEHPGVIHIINNEPFTIMYDFSVSASNYTNCCVGFLQPGEASTTRDLTEFKGIGELVIYKVDKDDMTNQDKWVPINPYKWTVPTHMFKSGGKLYTKDAYVPIEED